MTATLTAVDTAKAQIAHTADATLTLCQMMDAETAAIAARDKYFNAEVAKLIGQPNPLTKKEHSQASAEAAVKQTPEYERLATIRHDAEKDRLCASSANEAALLHARLAVAVLELNRASGDLH